MTVTRHGQLRLLIVDDEPLARQLLCEHARGRREVDLVGEAEDGPSAVQAIRRLRPTLLMLDVQMPGLDGFGVMKEVEKAGLEMPHVVFATAYDRYALKAFDVNAVDYLLKPISRARFDEALDRVLARAPAPEALRAGRSEGLRGLLEDTWRLPPRRLLVRERSRVVPVPLSSVEWLEAAGDYVLVHTQGKDHLVERTLSELEEVLTPLGFARVHRGSIVNLSRIKELHAEGSGRYRLLLLDGSEVVVSRSYAQLFHKTVL